MASLPVIHITPSKGYSTIGDCCVCCIATLANKEYEDVVAQAVQIMGEKWKRGMWVREIIQVAAACGLTLKRRRKIDYDNDCGILSVEVATPADSVTPVWEPHVVVLMDGKIYDNDLRVWDVDAYQKHYRAKLGGLLEVV